MRQPPHDNSAKQYERPNQPWVCGLADTGHSCPAGPTAHGRCPAMAECAPIRQGDRWECNRSDLRGGPCECGPTPDGVCGRVLKCHPTRSLRGVRGRFVRACALLTAGAAILCLSASWRDRAIAPGPLAQQHAQLMSRSGSAANCAACHAAATQGPAGWITSLVVHRDDTPTQSQLCMKCHSHTISSELAMTAHNVPTDALQQLTNREIRLASKTSQVGAPDAVADSTPSLAASSKLQDSIACAACHREHHGAQVDLTAMNNATCQSCHQQRFESFATDHPDFGIWPYERRTRIAFNHASHHDKHFAEKKQSFSCATCHTSDATGKMQLTGSYEATCATCHDEKISTSVARGVPMFALPTMDIAALRSAGLQIGAWPKGATGDFDGRFPPVMKLLLAADPAAGQALTTLGADFDFQDVDPKDRGQLEACAALATATVKLCDDLAAAPDVTVRVRLQTVLGRELKESEVRLLTGGLSADTLRSAVANWFVGSKTATPAQATPATSVNSIQSKSDQTLSATLAPAGDWYRDDSSFSIRYRPRAHADPVLATWLDALAGTPGLDKKPVAAAMFKDLSKATAPGLCASCHSVERAAHDELLVNWQARDRTKEPRGFTKFSHGPHLLIPQLADCTSCHGIEGKAATTTAYTDLDPAKFVSDFTPMAKQQCSSCHTAAAAGNACQSCHNYHVDGSNLAPRDLSGAQPGASARRLIWSTGTH